MSKPTIVVVGGGAGGLELVTRLGRRLGKKGKADVVLVAVTVLSTSIVMNTLAASVVQQSTLRPATSTDTIRIVNMKMRLS